MKEKLKEELEKMITTYRKMINETIEDGDEDDIEIMYLALKVMNRDMESKGY
jgi:hypothetical protein